jgi:poly(3-hydroxybutyrate) depolymerase
MPTRPILSAARILAALLAVAAAIAADAPRPVPKPAIPHGTWDADRADKLDQALDAFFAETSEAAQESRYQRELAPAQVGLTLDELRAIAKGPAENRPGVAVRTRTPRQELEGNARGWFNLVLPEGYTPTKSWGLVIDLHGSGSDGDNLPSFSAAPLAKLGYIVVYPTTTNVASMWEQPREQAEVMRLIEWSGRTFRVDFRRLVITGASMGGMGTWSHLIRHPELWSCGASVSGMPPVRSPELLERLRGIPFYVLHGEKDTNGVSLAPVEQVRATIAIMKQQGLAPVYVEVPGAGHTPPMPAWDAMHAWIAQQPRKAWSPRPLFLPPPGQRPLSSVIEDPLGLASDDPALQLIRKDHCAEAKALLTKRIATDPSRFNFLYRAIADVPGMLDDIPEEPTAKFFRVDRGWTIDNEAAALADIEKSIRAEADPPKDFVTAAYLMASKIHAKRFLLASGGSLSTWVPPYNAFITCIRASLTADPANEEASRLAMMITKRLPKEQLRAATVPPPGTHAGRASHEREAPIGLGE